MKNEDSAVAQAEAQLKSLKKYPRLESWRIVLCEGDPRFSDDPKVDLKLEGKIFDSPYALFPDGAIIQTLSLIAFDIAMRRAATTQAVYDLGEPDPAFLKYIEELGKELSMRLSSMGYPWYQEPIRMGWLWDDRMLHATNATSNRIM